MVSPVPSLGNGEMVLIHEGQIQMATFVNIPQYPGHLVGTDAGYSSYMHKNIESALKSYIVLFSVCLKVIIYNLIIRLIAVWIDLVIQLVAGTEDCELPEVTAASQLPLQIFDHKGQCCVVTESSDRHWLAVQPWACCKTSLFLSFLACELGLMEREA